MYVRSKKSSNHQLQALVKYMEEHPVFARGGIAYGSSKMSTEEQWGQLAKKLNSMGPPVRTILEWKNTWADLKSRTKSEIAENNKIIRETGGGVYRMCNLTPLEQIVDRTPSLSKSAAASGGTFGYADCITTKTVEPTNSFQILSDTPPRSSTVIAVITPTRQQQKSSTNPSTLPNKPSDTQPNFTLATTTSNDRFLSTEENLQKRKQCETEEELPGCSSAKKLKLANEQISLIRRQIRVSESSAATAREQADATKTLAEATKALVTAVERMADAAEIQAEAVKQSTETQAKILASVEAFQSELSYYFSKK